MPLYVLSNKQDFDNIIAEKRLNLVVFTRCWSYESKLCLAQLFDLSNDPQFAHLKFCRIDLNDHHQNLADQLNIVFCFGRLIFYNDLFHFQSNVPTVRWYCQGTNLDELIGIDPSQLVTKTQNCMKVSLFFVVRQQFKNQRNLINHSDV